MKNHLLDLCCAVDEAVVAELLSHIQSAEYCCVAGFARKLQTMPAARLDRC